MPMIRGALTFLGGSNLKKSGIPKDAPFMKIKDENDSKDVWVSTSTGEVVEVESFSYDKLKTLLRDQKPLFPKTNPV